MRLKETLLCAAALLWLAACGAGDAAPVVKIGLIAPFEGQGRPLGYAVLGEVKGAIAEANASGALGRYRVALVALNDDLDPEAAANQALALAQDPAVLAALGPFSREGAGAAAGVLQGQGVPALLLAPLDPGAGDGALTLCPPAEEIEALLRAAADSLSGPAARCADAAACDAAAFFGDAEAAALELLSRRSAGWRGTLLVGPDAVRPWFLQQAGTAAEGTLGAACSVLGQPTDAANGLPEAALARAAAERALQALIANGRANGRPSRQGTAQALAAQGVTPHLRWYQARGGAWLPLDEGSPLLLHIPNDLVN